MNFKVILPQGQVSCGFKYQPSICVGRIDSDHKREKCNKKLQVMVVRNLSSMSTVSSSWSLKMASNMSFKASVSLLIFCLDDLSINKSGALKSPTIIVLLSVSPFISVNICFMCLGALYCMHRYLQLLYSLVGLIPLSFTNSWKCNIVFYEWIQSDASISVDLAPWFKEHTASWRTTFLLKDCHLQAGALVAHLRDYPSVFSGWLFLSDAVYGRPSGSCGHLFVVGPPSP